MGVAREFGLVLLRKMDCVIFSFFLCLRLRLATVRRNSCSCRRLELDGSCKALPCVLVQMISYEIQDWDKYSARVIKAADCWTTTSCCPCRCRCRCRRFGHGGIATLVALLGGTQLRKSSNDENPSKRRCANHFCS